LQYPGVFRPKKKKKALRRQGERWPGQETKCRQPSWGWDHPKKPSEAKPISGEGFWLVKSRINDKEIASSMILSIPLKYVINRFALGRARTKDEHKTAGKMQKSPSHCGGRWSYLETLNSPLWAIRKGEKKAAQSFRQYLPLGLINCDPDLN